MCVYVCVCDNIKQIVEIILISLFNFYGVVIIEKYFNSKGGEVLEQN